MVSVRTCYSFLALCNDPCIPHEPDRDFWRNMHLSGMTIAGSLVCELRWLSLSEDVIALLMRYNMSNKIST